MAKSIKFSKKSKKIWWNWVKILETRLSTYKGNKIKLNAIY
jgi:hypothetical protein